MCYIQYQFEYFRFSSIILHKLFSELSLCLLKIENQNQKLLDKIMKIMKRRNKSVEKARERPENIIGGKMQFTSKYIKNKNLFLH